MARDNVEDSAWNVTNKARKFLEAGLTAAEVRDEWRRVQGDGGAVGTPEALKDGQAHPGRLRGDTAVPARSTRAGLPGFQAEQLQDIATGVLNPHPVPAAQAAPEPNPLCEPSGVLQPAKTRAEPTPAARELRIDGYSADDGA